MKAEVSHLAIAIPIITLVIAAEVDAACTTDPDVHSLATPITTCDPTGIGP